MSFKINWSVMNAFHGNSHGGGPGFLSTSPANKRSITRTMANDFRTNENNPPIVDLCVTVFFEQWVVCTHFKVSAWK